MKIIYLAQLLLVNLFLSPLSWASSACTDNDVRLQVLGSGGPELNDGRASSSYLIWANQKAIALIDVGGGSSLNYELSNAKFEDLDLIAFSHFHVDHSADFPVLIKSSFFSSRQRPLPIFGPDSNKIMPSTDDFMQSMFGEKGSFKYLGNYLTPKGQQEYWLNSHSVIADKQKIQSFQVTPSLTLSTISVHHGPLPALAWRVDIKGCSITFSGDMNNDFHTLEKLAVETDILVAHNAIPESATGVARNLHMPPSEIGLVSNKANVKKLIISHRMNRTLGIENITKQQIQKSYSGSIVFADDLDIILP